MSCSGKRQDYDLYYLVSPAIVGSGQVPFLTVVPFGERGTEVVVPLADGIEVKFFMSYKTL